MVLTIFRKFPDGDIIALFPEEKWTGVLCSSYMHIGQHSGADYSFLLGFTSKATPKEYEALKTELESIGYDDLRIRQKWVRGRTRRL